MHPDRYWLAKSGPQLAVMTGMSGKQMLLRSGIKYSCYFCDSSAEDSSQLTFKCVSLHQMNAHHYKTHCIFLSLIFWTLLKQIDSFVFRCTKNMYMQRLKIFFISQYFLKCKSARKNRQAITTYSSGTCSCVRRIK